MRKHVKVLDAGNPVALLLARPTRVKYLIFERRQIVEDGLLLTIDLHDLNLPQNRLVKKIM
jgi:hypothetical protein